jgi:hypothetical protein
MYDGECGAVGGILGKGNQSTWRKLPQCRFVHYNIFRVEQEAK